MIKFGALMFIVLMMATLAVTDLVCAFSTPSTPQFTVRFVDYSYDISPSYGIDPYNGQTVMKYSGDHIYNKTLEITIQNQPFTPSGDTTLYYNVRIKGAFEQGWRELFGVPCDGMTADAGNYRIQNYAGQTTFIRYTLPWNTPSTGRVDVQVQALVGTPVISANCRIIFSEYSYGFNGVKSSWSNTQSVSIGENAATANPPAIPYTASTPTLSPPTQTPITPETQAESTIRSDWESVALVIFAITTALLVVVVIFQHKNRGKQRVS
jgi:hypothetical protein